MNKIKIVLITLVIFGCNNHPRESPIEKMKIKFISSNYKNETEGKIEFGRIIQDSVNFHLIEGIISFDKNYNTIQEITNKSKIAESDIDSIKSEFKSKNFRENFDTYKKIVFVQLQPKDENDFQILDLRQTIEGEIDQRLNENKLGQWVAGDLGPGGANMLFEVKDWNKSISLIMEVLNSHNLLENSLIMKRLNLAENDWNYEVIFPIDYNGIFNQM